MIVVKIELVSAIHPSRSRELGRLVLTNDGKGTDKRCNYKAELMLLRGDVVQTDTGVSEAEFPCTCHNCGNQH